MTKRTTASLIGSLAVGLVPSSALAHVEVGQAGHVEEGAYVPDGITLIDGSSGGKAPVGEAQTTAYTYSRWRCNESYLPVQAQPSGYVIGNCLYGIGGELFATQQWPEDASATYLGGYITGGFDSCAWIEKRRTYYENEIGQTSLCPPRTFSLAPESFIYGYGTSSQMVWTHWVNDYMATGVNHWSGGWVANKNCDEYANFYPWRSGPAPAHWVRKAEANTTGRMAIRYTAKYPDPNSGWYYDMVLDNNAQAGNGNWVFFQHNCLTNVPPPGEYD